MNRNIVIQIILAVLVVVFGSAAYYFYTETNALKANPQQVAQAEAKQLVAEVGKLIVLPEGENPTIATVTDPDKLKSQPFFANAKKGDIVLIYTNAKKAILYDPVANKIIEVAPINIGNPQASQAPQAQEPTTTQPPAPKTQKPSPTVKP